MDKEVLELEIGAEQIRSRIYTIRGVQVMLDRDLAQLYNIETGALNRQVKRNIERFPDVFCFQLSQQELDGLKCQIGRTNIDGRGGRRTLPWVFTEQGISMLSSVIHGFPKPCKTLQPDAGGGGAKKWSCSSQPCHSSEGVQDRLLTGVTSVGNRRSCRCCP